MGDLMTGGSFQPFDVKYSTNNTSLSFALLAWKQAKSFHHWYVACSFWSSAPPIVEQLKMRVDVKETVNVMKFIRLRVFVQHAGKVSFYRQISQHRLLTFINAYYSLCAW